MVDAKGAILLFMLLAQTAHLAAGQCSTQHGSGECSEDSSSFSSASTGESTATSQARASNGPDGTSSTYSYASVSGTSDDVHATSSSSSSSSSGSSSSSAYAYASSSDSSSTESHTVTPEVTLEVPLEPETEEHPPGELPVAFYPCGHNQPVVPGKRVYFVTAEGEPCPGGTVTVTTHEPPKPSTQPVPPAPPAPPEDEHQVTARRVKALLESRNFTALSDFVIDSDDVYGINMGLRFEDHEQEEEIRITENREKDKDVVAIKGLASAALDYDTKLKVIQLMVVTATAPDGYQFNQHRELVESFLEIFADDELLATVIAANPEAYSRRRLQCAGCTPVNSYICAHCWPKSICNAYFWCSAGAQEDESEYETEETPDGTAVLSNRIESFGESAVAEIPGSTEEGGSEEESDTSEQSKKKRRRRRRRRQRKKANHNKSEDRDPTP